MKKRLLLLVFVVLVLLTIGFLLLLRKSADGSIYAVKQEDLVNSVLVNGTYVTASQTKVLSPTNGVITELFVGNSGAIKKGDPLFHVESSASEDQKKTAYANYLSASSTLQADNAALYGLKSTMFSKWKTYMDLATSDTYQNADKTPKESNRVAAPFHVAYEDWLGAEADYKNQQQVITKDQAALAAAKQLYDQTQNVTVAAPIEGTVTNLSARVGDQVSATGNPVIIITDFRNPAVGASVNEVNIPKIKIGQTVKIIFDALADTDFSGTVTDIDRVGTKTQGTITYNIVVKPDNLSSEVMPNMTASLMIETGRREGIMTIPNLAIIRKEGKTLVQKAGNRKNNLTEIALGLKGTVKSEVISGLSLGDRIIIQE